IVGMPTRSTNSERLLILVASIVGMVILSFVLAVTIVCRPTPPVAGDEVLRAVQQFSAAHRPLPATVTFGQLISEGYLSTNVLRKFGASDVTVYLKFDESSPQMFLMDAVMPDG